MKEIKASNEYCGFCRTENKSTEYMLHEDYILLSKCCESAARECYVAEFSDDTDTKNEALERLKEIRDEISKRLDLISKYETETEEKTYD